MSDLSRSHHPQPHHPPQPQPQQPLGHHQQHLHTQYVASSASAATPAPQLHHTATKRFGVSVPPVVLGSDAPSPYGQPTPPSAMQYGSLYAHQQALKDRMDYAFQQQQPPPQYANGNESTHHPPQHGSQQQQQGYYASYGMPQQHDVNFHATPSGQAPPSQQPHHSMGMPQLPEMQLPPHHDSGKDPVGGVDSVRKFRSLGSGMYLSSPSVYGAGTNHDQRTGLPGSSSASESYMSSIRFQHQQQQQQQQQQQSLGGNGGYRSVGMHSYSQQNQSTTSASSSTSSYYSTPTSRLSHTSGPELMTPAMAAAATAVAHGLRASGSSATHPQSMGGRLPRETMDNSSGRIPSTQQSIAALNNHQSQAPPPSQPMQQQPQQQPQPQPQQEVLCNFCYGGHCDRVAQGCGHRFHQSCLQAWGDKMTTCPLCIGSSNQIKAVGGSANGSFTQVSNQQQHHQHQQPGQSNMPQGYSQMGATLDHSSARGSVDLPPSAASGSTSANRQRSRTQQRPPPIDTTRSLEAMPSSKIISTNGTTPGGGQNTPSSGPVSRPTSATSSVGSEGGKRSSRSKGKKPLKECSIPGCGRTVRSRGLCKGHGGGRRCGFPGCGLSDQGGGFCISHGGGKRCQYESCENSAQSRGLCKLHGGGSRCTVPNCSKSSQGRGLCRAHGGGRRCMVEGCNKTDRRAGYCVTHGADKKCVVPECSKTGRIDGMCTKHYFERNQAALASQAQHAMMAAAAASKASRDESRAKKKNAPKNAGMRSKVSQLTPATSPTTPSLLNSLSAVTLLSSATAATAAAVGGVHGENASGGLGLDL